MDFAPSDDEGALLEAVDRIIERNGAAPTKPIYAHYGAALDRELSEGGFFDIARTEGFGNIAAGLVVERVAHASSCVEAAASALIAPQIFAKAPPRPIAITDDLNKPVRYLEIARTILVQRDEDVLVLDPSKQEISAVEGIYAYTYGRPTTSLSIDGAHSLGPEAADVLRRWRRVALALEAAGAMQAAVDFTVSYVKQRRQFNRAIGSFQAVQHRLAECAIFASGAKWLALQAAWSGGEAEAALAATYVCDAIPKVVFDCHQFNGALGMTLEHPLHFWTYRLKALQGEIRGGVAPHARAAAEAIWPSGRTPGEAPRFGFSAVR